MMEVKESIQSIVDKLSTTGDVKRIFGEPIEKNGRMIIPVAQIQYGFGGGGAVNGHETTAESLGGGGGISAKPVGMIEITDKYTRFVRFNQLPVLLAIMIVAATARAVVKALKR
jgi:uncharacterized spore protein YtfJ